MKTIYFILFTFLLTSSIKGNEIINDQNEENNNPNNELVFVKDVEDPEIQKTNEEFTVSDDVFIPTSEWQTLKKDQGIPRGLHVRLNVQTGEREAKLLEGTEYVNGKIVSAHEAIVTRSQEKIKEALRQLNDENPSQDNDQQVNEIKNKFRKYEELKEEMNKLNLTVQTDTELLRQLIDKYNSTQNIEEKITILNDLEYYVHRFDNGLLLCDMGGFELIVKDLNTTQSKSLQIQAALVLGSAMQSNPKVKVHAIKIDVLQMLLNHIGNALLDMDLDNQDFVSKLLFTSSSLLRHFPLAQSQFIRFGGVELMNKILNSQSYTNKLKIKVVTLANDLILEKIDVDQNRNNNTQIKFDQYEEVKLAEKLIEINWCSNFENLFDQIKKDEHDTVEKLTDSILNMLDHCKSKFKSTFSIKLVSLKNSYEMLSKEDDTSDDRYFENISNKLAQIVNTLKKEKNNEL